MLVNFCNKPIFISLNNTRKLLSNTGTTDIKKATAGLALIGVVIGALSFLRQSITAKRELNKPLSKERRGSLLTREKDFNSKFFRSLNVSVISMLAASLLGFICTTVSFPNPEVVKYKKLYDKYIKCISSNLKINSKFKETAFSHIVMMKEALNRHLNGDISFNAFKMYYDDLFKGAIIWDMIRDENFR